MAAGTAPQDIWRALEEAGTFDFPALSSGLYSAALVHSVDDDPTGYRSAWVRDNVYVAYALHQVGRHREAGRCLLALIRFMATQVAKMEHTIALGQAPTRSADRPHIRFDGEHLCELPVEWAHAQNDALGYLLWLAAELMAAGPRSPTATAGGRTAADVLAVMIRYLAAIRYWEDADSGHWEEENKVSASSVGTVAAGLLAMQACRRAVAEVDAALAKHGLTEDAVDALIERGRRVLAEVLPNESINGAHARSEDAAQLFLLEPLRIVDVDSDVGQSILHRIEQKLVGPHGVRRYVGDSYWAPDFRAWQAGRPPMTGDDYRRERDRLAVTGQEAQWGLFDPILCVIHARSKTAEAPNKRDFHFRRSLAQLTGPDDPSGRMRCVEAYFVENGAWVANDHVPLLWTQANLLLALKTMSETDPTGIA